MENLGFSLLGRLIWYNYEKCHYQTEPFLYFPPDYICSKLPSCTTTYTKGGKPYHRFVVSEFLKRTICKTEHIHHVDGDTLNNKIANLSLMNKSTHKKCHDSLQKCIAKLYCDGIVKFGNGRYYV